MDREQILRMLSEREAVGRAEVARLEEESARLAVLIEGCRREVDRLAIAREVLSGLAEELPGAVPAGHDLRPEPIMMDQLLTILDAAGRPVRCMTIDAPVVRDTGEYFEEVADHDSDELVVIDWARLVVQQVYDGEPVAVPLGVEAAVSTDLDAVLEWNTYTHPLRFTADDIVVLTMPWGEEIPVSLPPAASVTGRRLAAV